MLNKPRDHAARVDEAGLTGYVPARGGIRPSGRWATAIVAVRRTLKFLGLGLLALVGLFFFERARAPLSGVFSHADSPADIERQRKILNQLRDQINLAYGFRSGVPRVNLGPCGQFAMAFHEQWNVRFSEKAHISFVMSRDGTECYHVMVRLPGGSYYDGGNGIISGKDTLKRWPDGAHIQEMLEFDLTLLNKWSYGLERIDPRCPNYSGEKTTKLIESYLAILQKDRTNRNGEARSPGSRGRGRLTYLACRPTVGLWRPSPPLGARF